MSSIHTYPQLLQSPTSELRSKAIEKTELLLLKIARTNFNTQYASKSPLLADFRDAVSASTSDTDFVHDFRRRVPLSDYDAYRPFVAAFNTSPCKEAEVENLFAPGIPYLLAISSSTSGKEPKLFPKYYPLNVDALKGGASAAVVIFGGYRELKYVEREPGQTVKKIFVSTGTSSIIRAITGCTDVDEDASRMSTITPGLIAPFAASMITNHKSFLMIHALFALAFRDTDRILVILSTLLYDLLQYVDEQWELLVTSIESGTIPDLPGVREVHSHLQINFHADPERAAELREIGPPSSCGGWAARVWPGLKSVCVGCSGAFANVLPKLKSILGPTVAIHAGIYGASESIISPPYQPDDLKRFVLRSNDLIEFLDVSAEESHESLLQAWELEVGKQYEVVVTTNDGLWRYRMGDIIDVVGFDPNDGAPVYLLSGRRSLSVRLTSVLLSDTEMTSAVRAAGPDVIQVNEFTTVFDDRQAIATVGYLVELEGDIGPNAHLARSRISEGLANVNEKYRVGLEDQRIRMPTVRILGPGTFAAFRHWKAERMSVGPGQVKVPAFMRDEAAAKWILERVVSEL